MPDDQIRYDILAQEALRGVMRRLRAIEQRVEVELDRASVPW